VPVSVVLLHGFGGTRRAWDGVVTLLDRERYLPLALDLPGHGEQAGWTGPIDFAGCLGHVLDSSPEQFTLCGYSLGGRVALHVALAAPSRVTRLVLVSSSAGIEDPVERARRREADHALARDLEHEPYEDFVERWRSQPLFASEPARTAELARTDQLRNRPDALANALRGVGAGEMQPLWDRLDELAMPVTVLAGETDRAYVELGRRIVELVPDGQLLVVEGGHALVHEDPRAIADVLAA